MVSRDLTFLQGTISANSRYFSVQYYRQIILGDAFFGSDKALADNNSTLAIVEQSGRRPRPVLQEVHRPLLQSDLAGR